MRKFCIVLTLITGFYSDAASQRKVRLQYTVCAFNKPLETDEIYEWDATNQVLEYVNKICSAAYIVPNFKVIRASVDNAIATIDSNNNRVIYYSQAFFQSLQNETHKMAILAHEIGHFVNNHTFSKNDRRPTDELEADQFAGSILCKLGYHFNDTKKLLIELCATQGEGYYPARLARIEAFNVGFEKAGCTGGATTYREQFSSDFHLTINEVNHFSTKAFRLDKLNINNDFTVNFSIQSYRQGGSTRYGIAWNFNGTDDYLLFTLHSINGGYYTIGPGRNLSYPPFSRFTEGPVNINAESAPDVLQIRKVGNELIFKVNDQDVWRTSAYKLSSNRFAFWVADTAEAGLLDADYTTQP